MLPVFIAVALAGAIAHELAHWIVWIVTGRDPSLDIVKLVVRPRSGPPHTTIGDRLAASAPYILGAVCVLVGATGAGVLWMVFGLAMIGLPSAADVRTVRGQAVWNFDDATQTTRK